MKGNPHGNPVKETYKINNPAEVSYSDYYSKNTKVTVENFAEFWKQALSSEFKQAEEKMGMPYHNLKEAAQNFSQIIGLEPLNNIDTIDSSAKRYEFVYAYQNYENSLLFIKYQVMFNQKNKCLSHIIILSQDETVPDMIINKIYA